MLIVLFAEQDSIDFGPALFGDESHKESISISDYRENHPQKFEKKAEEKQDEVL